jgi:general secretion pathway protein G
VKGEGVKRKGFGPVLHAGRFTCAIAQLALRPSRLTPDASTFDPRPSRLPFSGFTLIELIITVAIVAILASAALPLAQISVQRGKEQELRTALRQIREAIDAYKQAVDEGRVARAADASGYPPALDALVAGVDDAKLPVRKSIYFLRRLPRDPFAPENIPATETWGRRSYASPPDAPREGSDVFDVYSLSERIGLNGVPYKEW